MLLLVLIGHHARCWSKKQSMLAEWCDRKSHWFGSESVRRYRFRSQITPFLHTSCLSSQGLSFSVQKMGIRMFADNHIRVLQSANKVMDTNVLVHSPLFILSCTHFFNLKYLFSSLSHQHCPHHVLLPLPLWESFPDRLIKPRPSPLSKPPPSLLSFHSTLQNLNCPICFQLSDYLFIFSSMRWSWKSRVIS